MFSSDIQMNKRPTEPMLLLASNSGTPGATRTHDTRFRKPLLYPPELQGHEAKFRNYYPYF